LITNKLDKNKLPVYYALLGLTLLAHLSGLLNDVFLTDSALYASIAKEMALSGNFLDLTFDGADWLDKPHFPFWVTAVSFKIFGINTLAYKIPAILFTLLALFYTYRLSRELYNRETALLAVLVLATAQHLIISNNDVRAEPILTGLVIGSIYHYHRLVERYHWTNLVWASLFAGLSVMTKGPFTLIPVVGAVAGEIIVKRQFRLILSSRWIVSLVLVALFITPELYALYHQFDRHPEKVVFGTTGVSGIRFFLWDSQFGRFFNTGPIKGSGDPFFFLHTLLWAFLPWSLVMYFAFFKKIIQNSIKADRQSEFYTISGALLTLVVFSFSGFQLPHYTNIIFPLLAMLTADWIDRASTRGELLYFRIAQTFTIILMLILLGIIHIVFRPGGISVTAIVAFLLAGAVIFLGRRFHLERKWKIIYYTALASILVNFYLNLVFYPELLNYQSGTKAARYANEHFPGLGIRTLCVLSFTLHFHANNQVRDRKIQTLEEELSREELLIYTSEPYLDSLQMSAIGYEILATFDHFHTTMLTWTFLNYRTRDESLKKYFLLRSGPAYLPNKHQVAWPAGPSREPILTVPRCIIHSQGLTATPLNQV
jgi:4-amino-4-deoxy-L-arabinose transferase-like glycosyltransferase